MRASQRKWKMQKVQPFKIGCNSSRTNLVCFCSLFLSKIGNARPATFLFSIHDIMISPILSSFWLLTSGKYRGFPFCRLSTVSYHSTEQLFLTIDMVIVDCHEFVGLEPKNSRIQTWISFNATCTQQRPHFQLSFQNTVPTTTLLPKSVRYQFSIWEYVPNKNII